MNNDCRVNRLLGNVNDSNLPEFGREVINLTGSRTKFELRYKPATSVSKILNVDPSIVFTNGTKEWIGNINNDFPQDQDVILEIDKYNVSEIVFTNDVSDTTALDLGIFEYSTKLKYFHFARGSRFTGDISNFRNTKILEHFSLSNANYITGSIDDLINSFDESAFLGEGKTTPIDLRINKCSKITGNLTQLMNHIASIASSGNRITVFIGTTAIDVGDISNATYTFDGNGGFSA